jgi:glycosyltransferase involved in cell wall biosynthesis
LKRILYIQYTNPGGYPPLEHSSKILADAGWQVLFLGTGASGADSLQFPPHDRITVRRMAFQQPGWRQKLHYVRFCLWVLWTVLIWRPRWVYASETFSCPVGLVLTCIPGFRVIYHEHDSPSGSSQGGGFDRVLAGTRRALARRADLCVLPNALRLQRFAEELGPLRASACVWNCPTVAEVISQPRGPASRDIQVLYHGSIVPDRLPPAVLQALALLPDSVHLRVVGYETVGAPGYVAKLQRLAEELKVEKRVEFQGSVPRSELLPQTALCDIGLALMPIAASDWNFRTMAGASNKPFDYLAAGVPVIVSDIPDLREVFVDSGYGVSCDPQQASSIAAAIRRLADDPSHMRRLGEAGRQRILGEWNYETAFAPVFRRITGN